MTSTLSVDYEDSDNKLRRKNGEAILSPALQRTYDCCHLALGWLKKGVSDSRCIMLMRTHVRSLDLKPHRLVWLVEFSHSVATFANRQSVNAMAPNEIRDRREWSASAWIVCRAAASILVQSVRPTSRTDFEKLLEITMMMQDQLPIGAREKARFVRRMQKCLGSVLSGLPLSSEVSPSFPARAASGQPSKARKYIPQAAHGVSAAAVH